MKATFDFYFKNGTVITSKPVEEEKLNSDFVESMTNLFTDNGVFIYHTLNIGGVIANVSEMIALKMNVMGDQDEQ